MRRIAASVVLRWPSLCAVLLLLVSTGSFSATRSAASSSASVRVTLNGNQFQPGLTLTIGVEAQNPLGNPELDLYVGAVLPDGQTAVFFTGPGGLAGAVTLSAPSGFTRMQAAPAGFVLNEPSFFQFTFPPTGVAQGTYKVFAALVRQGALQDNRIDPGDVLALDIQTLTFTEPVRLTSLSSTSAAPAQLLTLTGAGFDPTADLSVRFFDDQGFSVDVPVVDASATPIAVPVPPFINVATGTFAPGTVNVQVVQTSGIATLTSNAIAGFEIGPLPSPTGPPGRVTANVVGTFALVLQDVQNRLVELESRFPGALSTAGLRSTLNDLSGQSALLETQIRQIIANPTLSVTIGQFNGVPLILNQENLRLIDQLMGAYLLALSESTSSSSTATRALAQTAEDPCALRIRELTGGMLNDPGAMEQALARWDQIRLPCTGTILLDLGKKAAEWSAVLGTGLAFGGIALELRALAALAYLPMSASVFALLVSAQEIALGRETRSTAENALNAITLFQNQITTPLLTSFLRVLSPDAALGFRIVRSARFLSQELATFLSSIDLSRIFPAAPVTQPLGTVYKGTQVIEAASVQTVSTNCTPNPQIFTDSGFSQVELRLDKSLLVPGRFAGDLISGETTVTSHSPGLSCVESTLSGEQVVIKELPKTTTRVGPGGSLPVSGTSDGTVVSFDSLNFCGLERCTITTRLEEAGAKLTIRVEQEAGVVGGPSGLLRVTVLLSLVRQ